MLGQCRIKLRISVVMLRQLALLFKAGEESTLKDPYVEKLEALNFECRSISVLNFNYIHLDELKSRIDHPESYAGIILSSPRVVAAVKRCLSNVDDWRDLYAFVVGDKTAEDVQRLGLSPLGAHTGSGTALADFILQHTIQKPLLLPCGNLSTNTIFDKLSSKGVKVDRLVIYESVPCPDLELNVRRAVAEALDRTLSAVLFFSPSGVNAAMPLLQQSNIGLSSTKFGAIGPTTQKALSAFVTNSFVAEKPTPDHFIRAFQNHTTNAENEQ